MEPSVTPMAVVTMTTLAALVGFLLGYMFGWHRGLYRWPLVPHGRRPALKAASGTQAEPGSPEHIERERKFVEAKRHQVERDLAQRYPHLSSEERQAAVDEILTRGHALRVRGLG